MEDCFLSFFFKLYVRIGENGVIAYQSGYKALFSLQVTFNNQDIISFPHKCLTEIVNFH